MPTSRTPSTCRPGPAYTGPQDLKPGLPLLSEAVVSDAFEGFLTWILGLRQKGCWHVTQLTAPVPPGRRPSARGAAGDRPPGFPRCRSGALGVAALAAGLFLRQARRFKLLRT